MDKKELFRTRNEMWETKRREMNQIRKREPWQKQIEAFFEIHEDMLPTDEYFTRIAPSDEEIMELERELSISIPDDYRWFLKTFGVGGIYFEIYGYLDGMFTCIEPTLRARNELKERAAYGEEFEFDPEKILIVSYTEVYDLGIDTETGKVVVIAGDYTYFDSNCFCEYLLSEMECTIEEVYGGF